MGCGGPCTPPIVHAFGAWGPSVKLIARSLVERVWVPPGLTGPGDVYRRDSIDQSHYPVFHQMEGI